MADDLRDAGVRPFRVLATCGVFEPGFRGGGLVRAVAETVDTVSERVDLALITRDRDLGSSDPYPGLSGRWVNRNHSRVFYLDAGRPRHWLRLWRELRTARFDLLYVNSFWEPFTVVHVVAARLGLIRAGRVLVAPRGEFSPGALSLKARKKRLFLKGWQPLLKSMDVMWHASTDKEAAEIRSVCPWARVQVNQDQVSLPYEPIPATATDEGYPRLVFIGRISAMKNLELVLRTLRDLSIPAGLDIYGPLEDAGYWSRCRALIRQLPPLAQVRYLGELAPAEVRQTFSGYDAFVFPTLGENFGYVIAESLSASCPVICSDRTSWTRILEEGGGAVVRELTVEALGKEIDRIAAMTPAQRLAARQAAGRAYRSWRKGVQGTNVLDQARLTARGRREAGP
jgi:glycosyltransferase involved in cell wall biosynthesis